MLKRLMEQIHDRLEMPELSHDFGTQTYEQQVVELSKTGERGDLAHRGRAFRGRSSAFGGGVQAGKAPGGVAAQSLRSPWVRSG